MYSINGVALDNAALGWELLAPSLPLSALQQRVTRTDRPGRDGVLASAATRGQVTLKFTVRTPYANLPTLLALFSAPLLEVRELARAGWLANGVLVSSAPELHFPRADVYSHSFLVELPSGCWRGAQVTTSLVGASAVGAQMTLFSGLSAPVQDALIRIKGPVQSPQIVDSSGAFIAVDGTVAAGTYVRFDSSTGRAWRTSSDTWTGGSEVSGLVDFGGPRGVFEITPRMVNPSAPGTRDAQLTLTQASYTAGAGFQVRGAPAFLL